MMRPPLPPPGQKVGGRSPPPPPPSFKAYAPTSTFLCLTLLHDLWIWAHFVIGLFNKIFLTVLTLFSSYVAIIEKPTSLEETLGLQTLPNLNDEGCLKDGR